MKLLVRCLAAELFASVAMIGIANAQIATGAKSEVMGLRPLSPAGLQAAIAGLPNYEASGALVQVRGSAGEWEGSAGVSDIATKASVAANGRFRIGSMTKTFTAVVTLQLVAEGKLDLDQTIQHYLPDLLPKAYPLISVRQILTYSSGLNGSHEPSKDPTWFLAHRFDRWRPGDQLDLTRPLLFPPGTKQRYGNTEYIVAGLLIEKVTGRSWEHEVTRRIIRPLGLKDTSAPGADRTISGTHAKGYERLVTPAGARFEDVTESDTSLQWSAAAIISSAPDLDSFLVALFSGKLLPSAQLEMMFTVPNIPTYDGDDNPANDTPARYSAGLTRFKVGPLTIWGKTGDRPGYNDAMAATRDLSRRLVYSVNTLHMGGEQPLVSQKILGAVFLDMDTPRPN